jgi:hypothetical protein
MQPPFWGNPNGGEYRMVRAVVQRSAVSGHPTLSNRGQAPLRMPVSSGASQVRPPSNDVFDQNVQPGPTLCFSVRWRQSSCP